MAWVWSLVAALLGLGSLLFIGARVEHLAGPSRLGLMVNSPAACAWFLLASGTSSSAALCLYALLGGAMVAATWRLTPGGKGSRG